MKKNTGKIYLLINTEVNKERSVRDSLKMIESVILADMVTGRYDIIAVVEGDAVEHLFTTVMDKIRQIDGIVRTETNVAIE